MDMIFVISIDFKVEIKESVTSNIKIYLIIHIFLILKYFKVQ